jgi:hypothetical protein
VTRVHHRLVGELDGERVRIRPREFCCFPAGTYRAIVGVEAPAETLMIRAPSCADKV